MSGRANITYFPDKTNPSALSDAVEDMGFDSEVLNTDVGSAEVLKVGFMQSMYVSIS